MGLLSDIINRHRRIKATCTKALNDTGLTVTWSDGRPQQGFKWADVSEVRTYKVDCFAYDDICLAFIADGLWYEVSEQDDIFPSVMKIIEQRFPDIPEDWYAEVMLPAFKTNERVLWSAAGRI